MNAPIRRGFFSSLASIPLIGVGVTLIGKSTMASIPLTQVAAAPLLSDPRQRARYAWEAFSAAMREIQPDAHGWFVSGGERLPFGDMKGDAWVAQEHLLRDRHRNALPVAHRRALERSRPERRWRMNATTSTTAAAPLMSIHEVERRIGFSHQAIYRWMNAGQFPRPIKVCPVGVRWKVDEVERWVSERRRTVEQQCSLPPPSPKPTPSTAAEDRTARVLIPRPIRDALMPAATRRRIGLHALLVSILRVVADEDMVDAVLDDMTGGGA